MRQANSRCFGRSRLTNCLFSETQERGRAFKRSVLPPRVLQIIEVNHLCIPVDPSGDHSEPVKAGRRVLLTLSKVERDFLIVERKRRSAATASRGGVVLEAPVVYLAVRNDLGRLALRAARAGIFCYAQRGRE